MIHLLPENVQADNAVSLDELSVSRRLVGEEALSHSECREPLLEVVLWQSDLTIASGCGDIDVDELIAMHEKVANVDPIPVGIREILKRTVTVINGLPRDRMIALKHGGEPTVSIVHKRGTAALLVRQVDLGPNYLHAEDETRFWEETIFVSALSARPDGGRRRNTSSWFDCISWIRPLLDIAKKFRRVWVLRLRGLDAEATQVVFVAHIRHLVSSEELPLPLSIFNFGRGDGAVRIRIDVQIRPRGVHVGGVLAGLPPSILGDPGSGETIDFECRGFLPFIAEPLINNAIEALIDPLDTAEGRVKLLIVRSGLAIAGQICGRIEHHARKIVPAVKITVLAVEEIVFAEPTGQGAEQWIRNDPRLQQQIFHRLTWQDRSDEERLNLPRPVFEVEAVLRVPRDASALADLHDLGHSHRVFFRV